GGAPRQHTALPGAAVPGGRSDGHAPAGTGHSVERSERGDALHAHRGGGSALLGGGPDRAAGGHGYDGARGLGGTTTERRGDRAVATAHGAGGCSAPQRRLGGLRRELAGAPRTARKRLRNRGSVAPPALAAGGGRDYDCAESLAPHRSLRGPSS